MANGTFTFRAVRSEGGPTKQPFVVSTASVAVGDLVKLSASTGRVAPMTTGSGLAVGVVVGPADHLTDMDNLTADVSKVMVITDPDAVYGIVDANARVHGATLDIAGGTGAQSLAASSNKDFTVVASSTAAEETLVRIHATEHYTNA